MGAFFGPIMKSTKGQADASATRGLLKRKLEGLRSEVTLTPPLYPFTATEENRLYTTLNEENLTMETEQAKKPNPYGIAVEQFMLAADKLNLDEA